MLRIHSPKAGRGQTFQMEGRLGRMRWVAAIRPSVGSAAAVGDARVGEAGGRDGGGQVRRQHELDAVGGRSALQHSQRHVELRLQLRHHRVALLQLQPQPPHLVFIGKFWNSLIPLACHQTVSQAQRSWAWAWWHLCLPRRRCG